MEQQFNACLPTLGTHCVSNPEHAQHEMLLVLFSGIEAKKESDLSNILESLNVENRNIHQLAWYTKNSGHHRGRGGARGSVLKEPCHPFVGPGTESFSEFIPGLSLELFDFL